MSAPRIQRGLMAAEALGRDYTQVSNQLFRDPRIHAKSKGVFGFLASHRDGFGVSPESIAAAMADGISAVKGALRELEEFGYLARSQTRGADGLMGDFTYRITDMPSSAPVDGIHPPAPTCEDAENRRSQPVDGNPLAVYPPADKRPHKKTTPSKKISSEENTTTSSSPVVPEGPVVAGPSGGGGGVLDSSRSTAIEVVAALDYRGKVPDRRLRQTIEDRLTAALTAGWSLDGLAIYLDLGDAPVQSPAAVYAHRLRPDVLPEAAPGGEPAEPPAGEWQEATARARERLAGSGGTGTDDRVAGWGAVARQLGAREHKPYTNDAWTRPATEAEAAKYPWCGDPECSETDRMRDSVGPGGLPNVSQCHKCHPNYQPW